MFRGKAVDYRPRGSIKRSWVRAKGNIRVFISRMFLFLEYMALKQLLLRTITLKRFLPDHSSKPPEHLSDKPTYQFTSFSVQITWSTTSQNVKIRSGADRSLTRKVTETKYAALSRRMGLGPAFITVFKDTFNFHLPSQSILGSSFAIKHSRKHCKGCWWEISGTRLFSSWDKFSVYIVR